MIAIVDYGVGNLFSLECSFRSLGFDTCVTGDRAVLASASHIVLPGVGAFGDAIAKLREGGLDTAVKQEAAKGKPLLGICLGMQMLLEKSYEYGEHEGLALIEGAIRPISESIAPTLKVPHIGWNALHLTGIPCPILRYIKEGDFVYFVHSYHGTLCTESTVAVTEYGGTLTAAVAKGNVFGCQFHPEKSGAVGLSILRAFGELPFSSH